MQNWSKIAQELAELSETRKRIEKREAELKALVKDFGEPEIVCGNWKIIASVCKRDVVDTNAIAADMGKDFLTKYTKQTFYTMVQAKAIA